MRLLLTYFFILLGFNAIAQEFQQVDSSGKPEKDSIVTISSGSFFTASVLDTVYYTKFDTIVNVAKEYDGVRYKYGGMDSDGMDCSGLVCRAFASVNHSLPHSSKQLAELGVEIEADFLEKGDLIFFGGRGNKSINHVAIVSKVENGLIHIIHATSSRGVMEEILQENKYFMDRWLFNRRVE